MAEVQKSARDKAEGGREGEENDEEEQEVKEEVRGNPTEEGRAVTYTPTTSSSNKGNKQATNREGLEESGRGQGMT